MMSTDGSLLTLQLVTITYSLPCVHTTSRCALKPSSLPIILPVLCSLLLPPFHDSPVSLVILGVSCPLGSPLEVMVCGKFNG